MGPTTVPSATILETIYLRHPLLKSVAQRELQLQNSPPVLLQSPLGLTVKMSVSLCLGSHKTMPSTTSLREDQSSVTGCLHLEHLLDGLQRGVTYYISIVALSPHLPSPLVGPITVIPDPLLVVETSPESLTTSPNSQFSVNCTARAEVDGQSIPVDIEWTKIDIFSQSGPSELMPTLYTTTGSPERGYQSVLTTSENDTGNTIIYRCTATVSSYSNFSEITVHVKAIAPSPSTQSLTLTSTTVSASSFTSSTIAQNISDGGSGEDMPTTSNMDSDVAIPTATTITPKSTIATDMEARTKTITLTTTVTSTPVSEMCGYTKDIDKEPFTESTAVIAGGVGGGIILCQILVCLPIAIFCICNRSAYSKKVETHSNTAYGMVPARRREEPVYDVINQPLSQSAVKLPLSPNVAIASTAI
ncbi:hypothetical protein GBAR_LOCUS11852 [Geodia barretti]|uniref:Ig-like domain-containing protein n=1 Tax=Geodia barretti TaxID=519541 RepID=A0AA35WFN9_GEOBA|nr:hypothetical protein GBAR_LOCUS11852 [Geodia barretti]